MIKYVISTILLILSGFTVKNGLFFSLSMVELALIALITNSLKQVNRHFQILNNILILFFNAQNLVMLFGGSYIRLVMLENTDSIHMLNGRIYTYVAGVIAVLIASFLPVKTYEYKKKYMHLFILIPLVIEIICAIAISGRYTPLMGYVGLYSEWHNKNAMKKELLNSADLNVEDMTFFKKDEEIIENDTNVIENSQVQKEEINDNDVINEDSIEADKVEETAEEIEKIEESILDSNKNIIVVFTEGLSQSIIEDERNIMPNMAKLKDETIYFSNYYNHTFATYRGIQGQLYSGHQFDNYDVNNLTSVMDVLRDNGYYTAFINVEPNNAEFDAYQKRMGFDEVFSTKGYYTGDYDTDVIDSFYGMYPDKSAYDMIYSYGEKIKNDKGKFFLAIYTAGTHASFDSYEQKFGDGSDAELNKFYDCDYSFGKFFEKYKASELSKNTIFILTADHATYADEMYLKAFPDNDRIIASCDRIPFYIYFRGEQKEVDAAGRNSLCFAPTVLDLIGLKAPGTFLGSSLFKENEDKTSLEYYMWDPDMVAYTGNDVPEYTLGDEAAEVRSNIAKYCAISTK